MTITKDDFGKNFIRKFSQEHIDYIINFCNTFLETFPGIVDKEVLMKRISDVLSIKSVPAPYDNPNNTGCIKTDPVFKQHDIEYRNDLDGIDKENSIYHELFHALSFHREKDIIFGGLAIRKFYEIAEDKELDEIMNEFYTVKMLQKEGFLKQQKYYEVDRNRSIIKGKKVKSPYSEAKDKYRYYGNGYYDKTLLAEFLDQLFGDELLKAKLLDGRSFRNMFNQKYKDLEISLPQGMKFPLTQEDTPYGKFQFQIGKCDINESFETAIDIWRINEKESFNENGFNLYEYLKKTKELENYLPIREDTWMNRLDDRESKGLPSNIFRKIQQMDTEFICKYIKPEIMELQDEGEIKREINTLLSVIDILRENIQELSEQDVEKISYGKIKEYTNKGKDCLIINTKSVDFMTFVNNSTEPNFQFSQYSKFKKITDNTIRNGITKDLSESGHDIQDFTYAHVSGTGIRDSKSLVKSGNSYYRTSEEISEVKMLNVRTIRNQKNKLKSAKLNSELNELVSETNITDFNDMSKDIRNNERTNEQNLSLDNERT